MTTTAPTGRDLSTVLGDSPLTAADLRVGDWIEFATTEPLTAEEIIDFARRFDPLPYHLDPASVEAERFGGLIASGMHTMSLYASISVPAFTRHLALVAGKGIDRMRLPRPLRPGTLLHGRLDITDLVDRGARTDLVMASTMRDDAGDVVLVLDSVMVVESARPAV